MNDTVAAKLHFLKSSQTGGPVRQVDLRSPSDAPPTEEAAEVAVMNAHDHADLGLHDSGFELVRSPSAVTDFYDCDLVMETYYDECKAIARELTEAHTTFTFDHIIREPGLQLSGGGTDGSQRMSGVERGGGYIASVRMDYTDNTTWHRYLDAVNEPDRAALARPAVDAGGQNICARFSRGATRARLAIGGCGTTASTRARLHPRR